jgi:hypothetical protein
MAAARDETDAANPVAPSEIYVTAIDICIDRSITV